MFCNKCGKEVDGKSSSCFNCNEPLNLEKKSLSFKNISAWWCVLCSVVPILGIIFYFILRNNHKKEAGIYLKTAIVRFIVVALLFIFFLSFCLANIFPQVYPANSGILKIPNIYPINRWELLFFVLVLF